MAKIALLTLGLLGALPVGGGKIPQFLFAGQSNIIGSFVVDPLDYVRFNTTMQILLSTESEPNIVVNLVNHLKTATSSPPTPDSVYEFEANELLRLKREGYLTPSFQQPLSTVTCSFYKLDLSVDYRVPTAEGNVVAADANLSPYARCGQIYGPELMFGHVLRQSSTTIGNLFRIIKVAAGGTTIRGHWSKESGRLWPELVKDLNESFDEVAEEWKGIVWFQGENDSFNATAAGAYLGELTQFIANLREVMFNITTSFAQPSDIPVIIVGLGCWIARSSIGQTVMDAQKSFVASSTYAVLVPTHDLSCHYHFDDASMLIIGERIAKATLANFSSVLQPTTARPTASPTTAQPTTAQPTTAQPTTAQPTTAQPTAAPTTAQPTTAQPTTAPTTAQPITAQPTSAQQTTAPTTAQPTTAQPTTAPPTTAQPATAQPTTAHPTTAQPTTTRPTTARPTTARPTTARPTAARPTTARPTTARPTTARPTTARTTTARPTTARPTTARPTRPRPTTARPTTARPTTARPTTARPTTARPTTARPTTARPTKNPTQ
jgi:Carbohydrate esterase, sialic acid-specific acetylesterase/Keratin, high sulfur B2 protein